jgi:hypothetical protein
MDYWAATMQDDCYLIADDGWREAAQPRLIVEDKNKKTKGRPDFTLGKKKYQSELIPPPLIIRRWFADEQADIEKLQADAAAIQQQMEEMTEEQGGEEGLLADATNDKGKLTKASVTARLKETKHDTEPAEEIKALKDYIALVELETGTTNKLAAAKEVLMEKVAAKYPKLTEDEIKTLVVEDKWLATLAGAVQGELNRVSQSLTGRIRELAERYAKSLAQCSEEVAALSVRVNAHLKKMGALTKAQLLTGQARLPGFKGDWQVKRLGELATIRDGTHQTPRYVESGIPFYSVEHVTSGDFSNTKFISEEEHRFLTRSVRIEKGDILMTRIGSIGDCKLVDWDVEASFYVSLALLKIRNCSPLRRCDSPVRH